ncbi:MAG: permease [Methanomicrobia archaeon]|nr:permease [Methanomicrobia archaeon]
MNGTGVPTERGAGKWKVEGAKKRKKELSYGLYFLGVVLLLYLVLYLLEPASIQKALMASGDVLVTIAPILAIVICFMGFLNYFVTPKTISKYVGQGSGAKGWLLAIAAGILSHGAIYVWYPLLQELREQGMRSGLVAVFLYNRAIKLPLLPLMIYYFGTEFVGVLLIYMVIVSVIVGKLIEFIEGQFKNQEIL